MHTATASGVMLRLEVALRSLLITASVVYSISALAQTQADDFSRLQQQMQVDQMNHQLRMQQLELETERIRAATRRLAEENERREESERADALRAAQDQQREEDAKKASDEADELREQVHMASVRAADNMFLLGAVAVVVALLAFVIRRHHKESTMRYEQKFGVVLVVASILGVVLALMMSRDWVPRLDIVQNIMLTLHIGLIQEDSSSTYSPTFMVDVPTKFVLLAFFAVAAYGLLAYLGIVPPVGGKKEAAPATEVA